MQKFNVNKLLNPKEKFLIDGCHSETSAKNLAHYLKSLLLPEHQQKPRYTFNLCFAFLKAIMIAQGKLSILQQEINITYANMIVDTVSHVAL